ncbi:MAG TPA: winged helix-turn-helix domain-containing protein [Vicinamibacterales bacterium]|nr:winged helix-turn-helix domain-containing protein [Vicinamibacterales bacterium]
MGLERYSFGDVTLDVSEHRVRRGGHDVSLSPKAWDVLVHLVRHAGHLVTKQELLDAVWPSAFVEEGIVAVHVSGLRKALGEQRDSIKYIETVAKSGYRFVAPLADASVLRQAKPASTPEVSELLGRGRAHLMSAARTELPQAVGAFEAAIELDATCAAAHSGLALAFCAQAELRVVPPADGYGRARISALRALAMDESSSDAWTALGCVMFMAEWDWIGAERSLQRALELDPRHTQARLLYGRLLDAQGRLDEGLAMKLRALETDPFSPSVHVAIALSYWNQRKYDEAIRWANKTLTLDPHHGLAREFLAGAYWKLGDFDRHMTENLKHAAAHGVPAEALEPLKRAYSANGRTGVVRFALDQAARQSATLPDIQLALFHSELGDLDAAIPHLERAIERRDPCLVDLAVAPQWDALREDQRFQRCLAGMGLAATATSFSPAPPPRKA